ncbi:DUF397 domain-containing protein [Streptomyces sp. AV19]|uniref:DUF397 domain-containing protein n=1 Tax=Streptomyces sp. AV19 TaxID=2793068 RepID=UPI0018FEADD2|nr:DUF397 domain-containing protein [Streptomyces sp. AV19]MBH1935193.1 DUF397 domain-containing protein [Streptomyces sp. AV19]MDG4532022.1 DUF397 domain-containing protein [Streptomyces sp. AV19]
MISASRLRVVWHRSSHSSTNGGNCVEVGDLIPTEWIKSSYSSSNGGQCLGWAPTQAPGDTIPIRDSKRPTGPALLFPTPAWRDFLGTLTPQ